MNKEQETETTQIENQILIKFNFKENNLPDIHYDTKFNDEFEKLIQEKKFDFLMLIMLSTFLGIVKNNKFYKNFVINDIIEKNLSLFKQKLEDLLRKNISLKLAEYEFFK